MANFLSPLFNDQTFTANGDPAVGYKVNTYEAGTSTPIDTFTTKNGSTAQSNPIVLNARGAPDDVIWLAEGVSYKFVLTDANDVVIDTFDNISGINDTSVSSGEWTASGYTPTYIGATSFSVVGDRTGDFLVGRRIRSTNTSGTTYSLIASSSYSSGTGLTTVAVSNDSGTLDAGLSAVDLAILTPDNPSFPNSQESRQALGLGYSADIASAATLDLTARSGKIVRVTGTNTTTALTMANGDEVLCIADGAWPINVSGVLVYTCTPEDSVLLWQDGDGVQHASVLVGKATEVQAGPVELATDAEAQALSSDAVVLTPGNLGAVLGAVKLASGTVSAAATLDIVMTGYTAYRNKLLILDSLVPVTSAVDCILRVSTNGGSSYDAGASDYKWSSASIAENTVAADGASGAANGIRLQPTTVGNTADYGINSQILLFATTSAIRPRMQIDSTYINATNGWTSTRGMGVRDAAQDTDAIRILFSSGNIASGAWSLYGWN